MDRFLSVSLKCVLVLVLLQVSLVQSYKILMVFPSHSHSHLIIGSSLLKGLAEKGHEVSGHQSMETSFQFLLNKELFVLFHQVTMVSSFPQKEKIPNYRDVYVEIPGALKSE